ncbi:hypothetical protein SAMN05421856_10845 [Chryseobacterium taichungense]|uniref:Uncharacterized protein n=1 Tax=Chryseobacterium taichungense TaxID=295069 RepID=A0A1H8C4Y3_9FLAO|nr:hypothetical protein [Chryseobacterium taichungense]SEM89514.1 hypothetical protein SAMN05421856_10845 [Chryseobacterium taichungense]
MKFIYSLVLVLLFSCSETAEDRCFSGLKDKLTYYQEKKPFTAGQILENKPDYLEIINLEKYRSFKQDSLESRQRYDSDEILEKRWKTHQEEYKIFKEKFSDQFSCSHKQQVGNSLYALGTNDLGFWLLKIENNKPSAYFLGLCFSHYYVNGIQQKPIINGNFLELEGSFVKIIKVPGLPGYDDYSAISDGKLFKINLKDLTKDSDHDGYNDIFEKSFGLNPENKDTDGDGITDFDDLNPMFRSSKNKFTELYELLMPQYAKGESDLKKQHYTFIIFENDCDYFHQVSPDYRILFISESDNKKTYYVKMTDVTRESISKMKKDKKDPDKFYISKSGSSYERDYAAEYKNGKWELEIIGGIDI